MRPLFYSLILSTLASCTPNNSSTTREPPPKPATPPTRVEQHPGNTKPLPVEGQAPVAAGEKNPLNLQKATVAGVALNIVSFDTRDYSLKVVDQASPGSTFETAAQVTKAKGALATINGGFFTPEGTPLVMLYQNGKRTGTLNTASSLGSGVLYIDKKSPEPSIIRRELFRKRLEMPDYSPQEALQTGPYLVEAGKAVSGLSNKEARNRSILLWDGEHHFAIAQTGPITLRNLAGALAKQPLTGFQVQIALNLDGGRSADLNVSSKVSGGPLNLRGWINKPVRNYLILTKS